MMRTRTDINKIAVRSWDTNDQSGIEMIIIDLLLDIRELLSAVEKKLPDAQ